jgi:hypothetical protein
VPGGGSAKAVGSRLRAVAIAAIQHIDHCAITPKLGATRLEATTTSSAARDLHGNRGKSSRKWTSYRYQQGSSSCIITAQRNKSTSAS